MIRIAELKLPLSAVPYHPDNHTGITHIYGRAADCEVPFLQGLKPGATITVLGYFLGVLDNQALFSPCYLLD